MRLVIRVVFCVALTATLTAGCVSSSNAGSANQALARRNEKVASIRKSAEDAIAGINNKPTNTNPKWAAYAKLEDSQYIAQLEAAIKKLDLAATSTSYVADLDADVAISQTKVLLLTGPSKIYFGDDQPVIGEVKYFQGHVIQVIDPRRSLVSLNGRTFLLEGINVTNFADGDEFATPVPVEVDRIQEYTTVLGASRRVFVLKSIGRP